MLKDSLTTTGSALNVPLEHSGAQLLIDACMYVVRTQLLTLLPMHANVLTVMA